MDGKPRNTLGNRNKNIHIYFIYSFKLINQMM